jgi:hypothetical protein
MVQFRAHSGNNMSIAKQSRVPFVATKGCASCPLYEKGWRRGVGRQRNRLVDNELTRQTPAPNPLANLAQGGLGAGDSGTDIGMS